MYSVARLCGRHMKFQNNENEVYRMKTFVDGKKDVFFTYKSIVG